MKFLWFLGLETLLKASVGSDKFPLIDAALRNTNSMQERLVERKRARQKEGEGERERGRERVGECKGRGLGFRSLQCTLVGAREEREKPQERQNRKTGPERGGGRDREGGRRGPTSMLHINSSGCDPM